MTVIYRTVRPERITVSTDGRYAQSLIANQQIELNRYHNHGLIRPSIEYHKAICQYTRAHAFRINRCERFDRRRRGA